MPHNGRTLRVLNINHSLESDVLLFLELEKLNTTISSKKVSTFFDLREALCEQWNIVICNNNIIDLSMLEVFKIIQSGCPHLPIIIFTDKIEEETLVDLIKAGVEDVVIKSRIERLVPTIKRVLRESEMRTKEALARRIANEAHAAKEQMLAIVSHDIKNPLSAIQLEAQMLLRATDRSERSVLAEEVKIQANRILKTTDRLKILISDLLDKNKSENSLSQVSKSSEDVSKLLKEATDSLRPLIAEKNIQLRVRFPDNVEISLDRNKMFQVFSNLINNAIKFSPIGGIIHIELEEDEQEYRFLVEDSGPGLDQNSLHRVFEKYWTGDSPDGTGLGLFICKTIIDAHKGQIYVENKVLSNGARFKFTLPKIASNRTNFSYFENPQDLRKRIYIVDDDEDLREVISWALNKEGHAVFSFESPHEALQCLESGKNIPDLIVVDFHMDEMKGSEFVKKKAGIIAVKDCPVLMISASPQDVEKEVPVDLYQEIITKPIDLMGLVDNINVLCERPAYF